MYIRCLACRGVTWVEGGEQPPTILDCRECPRQLLLRKAHLWKTDDRSHFEDASKFAAASGIDLPSANSVLLGVMTLHEALSIQGQKGKSSSAPEQAESAVREALELLERSHKKRIARLRGRLRRRFPKLESRAAILASVAMFLASIAVGWSGWNEWRRGVGEARALEARNRPMTEGTAASGVGSPRPERHSAPIPRTRRDPSGRVVQIMGSSPEAVLRAFCQEEPAFEPIELASTEPARIGARIGIFRDYRDLTQRYGIWIQRRQDRRWAAGNGAKPLRPFVIEQDRVGSERITVKEDARPGQTG